MSAVRKSRCHKKLTYGFSTNKILAHTSQYIIIIELSITGATWHVNTEIYLENGPDPGQRRPKTSPVAFNDSQRDCISAVEEMSPLFLLTRRICSWVSIWGKSLGEHAKQMPRWSSWFSSPVFLLCPPLKCEQDLCLMYSNSTYSKGESLEKDLKSQVC